MIQRQIKNHKNDNLLVLIGSTGVLPKIILKFKHLKYRRSDRYLAGWFYLHWLQTNSRP